MKKHTIFLLLFATSPGLFSQSLAPTVVATAGGYGQDSVNTLSWTVGEMAAATLPNDTFMLTQGFQQHFPTIVSVFELDGRMLEMRVFPNPFRDVITVELQENFPHRVVLTNMVGQTLLTLDSTNAQDSIYPGNLPPGVYCLTVYAESRRAGVSVNLFKK